MPMTTTHALVPLAVAVAVARKPVAWKLIIAASVAAAAPDLDGLAHHLFGLPTTSIYSHRGAAHSLFAAILAGLIAATFHKRLGTRPLTAGVIIFAAMASHGALDMMTDSGRPVAYLWPLSSARLFADWRPIHTSPVHMAHLVAQSFERLELELRELIIPMFAIAFGVRGIRNLFDNRGMNRIRPTPPRRT